MSRIVGFTLLVLVGMGRSVDAANLYAKVAGLGSGACDTWTAACSLPYAIQQAALGDAVWVKAGVYAPIEMINGVKIIGGFAGTETLASQSDPNANVTIIDGSDANRCVTVLDSSATTVLRGFTIRNGLAASMEQGGGGMLLVNSSAKIVQCVFEDNAASWFGGAVSIEGSGNPQFVNCIFRRNGEKTVGGGQLRPYGAGAVLLKEGSATFTNCLFYANSAAEGAALANLDGTAVLHNCTVVGNTATIATAGGLFDQEGTIVVKNSIIWGNAAQRGGNQILNSTEFVSGVTNSDVQGGWTGSGNINNDPLFAQGYRLQGSSPCRNTGVYADAPKDVADLDWDGNVEEKVPFDLGMGPRRGDLLLDMGAYEVPTGTGDQ